MQYNRAAVEMSALSGKIDWYENLTGEEILAPKQDRVKEGAKFTYSSLRTTFEKQAKKLKSMETWKS